MFCWRRRPHYSLPATACWGPFVSCPSCCTWLCICGQTCCQDPLCSIPVKTFHYKLDIIFEGRRLRRPELRLFDEGAHFLHFICVFLVCSLRLLAVVGAGTGGVVLLGLFDDGLRESQTRRLGEQTLRGQVPIRLGLVLGTRHKSTRLRVLIYKVLDLIQIEFRRSRTLGNQTSIRNLVGIDAEHRRITCLPHRKCDHILHRQMRMRCRKIYWLIHFVLAHVHNPRTVLLSQWHRYYILDLVLSR